MFFEKVCVLIDDGVRIKGNVFVGEKEILREVLGVDKGLSIDLKFF